MNRSTVVVFSGGIGLGAYQAGVYEALHDHPALRPAWLLGSSVGAVNAAVIAGNHPERRNEALRQFWSAADHAALLAPATPGSHVQNWMSAMQARVFGVSGYFRPRIRYPFDSFASIYDLAPMRARLERLIDFERLNAGAPRFSVATTDVETGDLVLFDTARGDRIGIDHLMASCGFLPEFAPVEIDGRLLGDGGLSANAPVEPVFADTDQEPRLVFVVDLFSRQGERPTDFAGALARKNDLVFGNQTWLRLQALQGAQVARRALAASRRARAEAGESTITTIYLGYDPPPEEAGSEKPYDLSRRSIDRRWQAGARDMEEALRRLNDAAVPDGELVAIRRR